MMTAGCCVQVGEGVVYVAAGSNPGQFGLQLSNALQVLEQLPNPVTLVYDYVLRIGGMCHSSGHKDFSLSCYQRLRTKPMTQINRGVVGLKLPRKCCTNPVRSL